MNNFRIDLFQDAKGRKVKVTAECRSVADITDLIASLKAVRAAIDPTSSADERGRRGGFALAAALLPKRRAEIASNAANARWKKE